MGIEIGLVEIDISELVEVHLFEIRPVMGPGHRHRSTHQDILELVEVYLFEIGIVIEVRSRFHRDPGARARSDRAPPHRVLHPPVVFGRPRDRLGGGTIL